MTYYEIYSACQSVEEIKEKAKQDAKEAIYLLGNNPDRIKAIEEAMNKAISEKAESEE